jgi:hypothetical protein
MEVTCLLCDWAQEVNGKLYIQGAGWDRLVADQLVNVAVAVLVEVPWDQTNRRHTLRGYLRTQDGEAFLTPDDAPVELSLEFEVGRPPGMRHGASVHAPFTMTFAGLSLPVGGYSFGVEVNGEPKESLPFEVQGG